MTRFAGHADAARRLQKAYPSDALSRSSPAAYSTQVIAQNLLSTIRSIDDAEHIDVGKRKGRVLNDPAFTGDTCLICEMPRSMRPAIFVATTNLSVDDN